MHPLITVRYSYFITIGFPILFMKLGLTAKKPTYGLPILLRMKSRIGIITSEIFLTAIK
jgi:hypothetical protein